MRRLMIAAALVALTGCTDAPEAERALLAMGFKEVQVTGYRFWACGRDEAWKTGFEATSPAGVRVTGAVCSSVLRAPAVRLD